MDFISIDFEIANRNTNSACSLGMVFVQNNKVVDEKYFLIKPPTNYVDPSMSKVHGLTWNDLKDAPSFDDVWNEISRFFHDDIYIIAHNAQFDMNVLKNCLLAYNLEDPVFNYVCSIPISTRACRGEGIPNSLKARTERFGITIDNHHNALSDAKAVAELVLTCIKLQRRKSIHTYFSTYRSIPIRSFRNLKHQPTFKGGNRFNRVLVKDITPENKEFNEEHPLFDKTIVFTGELENTERAEAMQMVVNVGAKIRTTVSRLTNFVVVGKQDKTIVGKSGQSSKERKAHELIEQGFDIKIINEAQLLDLLESLVTN